MQKLFLKRLYIAAISLAALLMSFDAALAQRRCSPRLNNGIIDTPFERFLFPNKACVHWNNPVSLVSRQGLCPAPVCGSYQVMPASYQQVMPACGSCEFSNACGTYQVVPACANCSGQTVVYTEESSVGPVADPAPNQGTVSEEKSATEESTTEEKSADEPAAEEPTTEEKSADEPAAEESTTEEKPADKPAAEESTTEEKPADKPAAEESTTEEATEPAETEDGAEEPKSDEPADEPAADEPADETADEPAKPEAKEATDEAEAECPFEPKADEPADKPADEPAAEPADDAAEATEEATEKSEPECPFESSLRIWKDKSGQFSRVGKLVEVRDGFIRIAKENGGFAKINVEALSDIDQEYVAQQTALFGDALAQNAR